MSPNQYNSLTLMQMETIEKQFIINDMRFCILILKHTEIGKHYEICRTLAMLSQHVGANYTCSEDGDPTRLLLEIY